MLITFRSENSAPFSMFSDIGVQLIKMMGHSGTVPGAIAAEDVPEALAKLRQALANLVPVAPGKPEDEEAEEKVELPVRAAPLVEMLTYAAEAGSYVMWDK
jgi:hypothetical protein